MIDTEPYTPSLSAGPISEETVAVTEMIAMEAVTADALEGALRRHMEGSFAYRDVVVALVSEGWRHPLIHDPDEAEGGEP